MNNSQLPLVVRATAAALAVYMTIATLNGVISIAEPQRSQLIAHNAARQAASVASTPRGVAIVAQAPTSTPNH
jgi:hypothetical protein